MTYSQKLKDPRWQKKRLEIIDRDGYKCIVCGSETDLHVHHGYYGKNKEPWDYEDESLHTLCSFCHDLTHDTLERINRNIGLIDPSTLLGGDFERLTTRFKFR